MARLVDGETIELPWWTNEKLEVPLVTPTDPTGGDPPEFAFVKGSDADPTGDLVVGEWDSWSDAATEAVALTQRVGGADATTDLTTGESRPVEYAVFAKFPTPGSEAPARQVGVVRFR